LVRLLSDSFNELLKLLITSLFILPSKSVKAVLIPSADVFRLSKFWIYPVIAEETVCAYELNASVFPETAFVTPSTAPLRAYISAKFWAVLPVERAERGYSPIRA